MNPFFSSSLPRTACIRMIYVTPDFNSCLLCREPDGFSVCLCACLSTLFLWLTVVLLVVLFGEYWGGRVAVRKAAVRKGCCAVWSWCCLLGFLTLSSQFPPALCCSMGNTEMGKCVNGSGTKQAGDVWSTSAGAGDLDSNCLLTGKNLPPPSLGGITLLPPARGNWQLKWKLGKVKAAFWMVWDTITALQKLICL